MPYRNPSSSVFQRTALFIWASWENACAGFPEGCGTDRGDEAGTPASRLGVQASLSPESSSWFCRYRSTTCPPYVSSTADCTLVGWMHLFWCGFFSEGFDLPRPGSSAEILLDEMSVLEWGFVGVSPFMAGFEVCVLFWALQRDRDVFYENDLFLCGLWLHSCSCSVAAKEWEQAKDFPHGCLFLCEQALWGGWESYVYTTGCLVGVPSLPLRHCCFWLSYMLLLQSVWYRKLVWRKCLSLLLQPDFLVDPMW